jgi:TRAP-type C4-dicarboxylate transport system permease large subunit
MAIEAKNYDCCSVESPFVKALAAVPTLGSVVTMLAMTSINSKLQTAVLLRNEKRVIEVLEHKKDYLWASIVGNMLGVALAIAGLVSGFFVPVEALGLGLVYAGIGMIMLGQYLTTQSNIEKIKESGITHGMLIQ